MSKKGGKVSLADYASKAEEVTAPPSNVTPLTLSRDNVKTLRKPHTSLYHSPAVQRAIKDIALNFDKRPHDIYLEAVDLVLTKYGRPTAAEIDKK